MRLRNYGTQRPTIPGKLTFGTKHPYNLPNDTMRRNLCSLSVAVCTVLITICLILSSGCIQPEQTPTQITLIDPPEDMTRILNEYETVMTTGANVLSQQLRTETQDLIRNTDNTTKIREILLAAYAANPEITAIAWNPPGTGDKILVPSTIPRRNEYLPQYQETDFNGRDVLFTEPTYIHEYGHVMEINLPAYTDGGTYAGYLSFYTDCGILFHRFAGEIPELTNYSITILKPEGRIVYCTDTEYNGVNLTTASSNLHGIYNENQTVPLKFESGATIHHVYSPLYLETCDLFTVWKTIELMGIDLILIVERPVEPWSFPAYKVFTPDENGLMQDVLHIRQYAASHTKEQTLAYLRTLKLEGDRSIVAFDMDGYVLATSENTIRISGTSYHDLLDAYDVPVSRHMVYLAQQGGGVMYKYEAASFGDIPTQGLLYLIYVIPIDDSWIISVYTPAEPQIRPMYHQTTMDTIKFTRSVVEKAWKEGKDAVLADINSGSSQFITAIPGQYTFMTAVDMRGNVLADSRENMTGTNIFSIVDVNDASIGRQSAMYAKNGGGLLYSAEETEDPNTATMYILSVEPVDETWFIAVGVKIDQIQRLDGVKIR